MTTNHPKRRRAIRSARLESKVEPAIYLAVEDFAIEEGYTLSSAVNRILVDWHKGRKKRRPRNEIKPQ